MTSWFLSFGLLFVTIDCSNFNCNDDEDCYGHTLNCEDGEDCWVTCSGEDSCREASIHCPQNGDCYIDCSGDDSCRESSIYGTSESIFNVTCTGEERACREATISGSSDTEMNIVCGESSACYETVIDGRDAEILRVMDCATGLFTCIGSHFYCPPNRNGQKRCMIQGDDSLGSWSSATLEIYAVNSWNDIEFDTTGHSYRDDSIMHCTEDYSSSCTVSSDAWECDDTTSICQNPPTYAPTSAPTISDSPSVSPTNFPSNVPSDNPTEAPTANPIENPSNDPTSPHSSDPTRFPSRFPSTNPTFVPTSNPTVTITESPTHKPTTDNPTTSPTVWDHPGGAAMTTNTTSNNPFAGELEEDSYQNITDHPLFYTLIGCILGCLLYGTLFLCYVRYQNRKRILNQMDNTFHSTSIVKEGVEHNQYIPQNQYGQEGPSKTSISMQYAVNGFNGNNGSYPRNGSNPFLVSPSNRGQFESVNSFSASPASVLAAQSPVSFNRPSFNEEMIVNMAQNVNYMLNHVTLGGPTDSGLEIVPPPPEPPQMEDDIDLEYGDEVEGDVDEQAIFNVHTKGDSEMSAQLPAQMASVSMATTVSGISMESVIDFMNTPQEPPRNRDGELIEVDEVIESSESGLLEQTVSPRGNVALPVGCDADVDMIDTDAIVHSNNVDQDRVDMEVVNEIDTFATLQ